MNLTYRLLAAYSAYVLIAAAVVFFAPHKYEIYIIGLLVFGSFGLWRIRRLL